MNGIYSTLAILCCAAFILSYTLAVVRNDKYAFYYVAIPSGISTAIFTFLGGFS
jgi:hypothetical protein